MLVTDGDQRSSLAVVRSLGAAGHRVLVCSPTGRSLAGASRFSSGDFAVPSPLVEPDAFLEAVRTLVRSEGADVLVPMTDPGIEAVLDHRDDIEALLPLPDAEVYRAASDKAHLLSVAQRQGLAVPGQRVLSAPLADPAEAVEGLAFPLVLKPTLSTRAKRSGGGLQYVEDRPGLARALADYRPDAYPILVQERIVGTGAGVFLLIWDGKLLACFAHRRIREKPPSGGVSVCREAIDPDPVVLEKSVELMGGLGWRGVCMVEFKVEENTGVPYVMEVNGRFWGSLQLAIDAGVDFPVLLLQAATGGAPEPVLRYRTGVRTRWLWGEMDHLLLRARGAGADTDGASNRGAFRALLDVLPFRPGRDHTEVLRLRDPRPFLRESVEWIRDVVGRS